jgi:8-oxo-dGTP pyrophosphatase MutT (NUDIX family)
MDYTDPNRERGGMILVNNNGEVLLLKGADTAEGPGKWSFPKGAIEPQDGESLLKTAVRETAEETGLVAEDHYTIASKRPALQVHNNIFWLGVMRPDAPAPTISADEISEYRWVNPKTCRLDVGSLNAGVRRWLNAKQRS